MKKVVEIIFKWGKRLENLVKNAIDISLIESKCVFFRREREDNGKLINECVNNLIFLADRRELSLDCNVQEIIFIQIDKNKILQVLKNIISNAIQNTPLKGKISINLKKREKNLVISIKDTGVGFSETDLQRIFQTFGKVERYGKDYNVDIEGSGLGLYLAKKIIENDYNKEDEVKLKFYYERLMHYDKNQAQLYELSLKILKSITEGELMSIFIIN